MRRHGSRGRTPRRWRRHGCRDRILTRSTARPGGSSATSVTASATPGSRRRSRRSRPSYAAGSPTRTCRCGSSRPTSPAESPAERRRMALEGSPGHGSCGGMFTYNTMQSFIATCGMEPLHMVSPASEDRRRLEEFPAQLLDALQVLSERGIRPRDIVTPASLCNATLVAIAMGGSTNVVLHAPELARAAGLDFWRDVITQEEFNRVSR